MRILVTAGATREPIDGIRFISNVSTGETGARIADTLARAGHAVVALVGQGARPPEAVAEREEFTSFSDLDTRLQKRLASGSFDLVVHCAAVSDYSVREIRSGGKVWSAEEMKHGKLDSRSDLELVLSPNFKIVSRLKSYAAKPLKLIAFKLTHAATPDEGRQAVERLLTESGADIVVHNDWTQVRKDGRHPFTLYTPGDVLGTASSPEDLAQALLEGLHQIRLSSRV